MKWITRLLLLGLLLVAILCWKLHPFLAVQAPLGRGLLVVEGWIGKGPLEQAAERYAAGGYTQVATVGGLRPCAFYLKVGERALMELTDTLAGQGVVNVSGIQGAGFELIADGITVLRAHVAGEGMDFPFHLPKPTRKLELLASNNGPFTSDIDDIFVREWTLAGSSLMAHVQEPLILARTGTPRDIPRTYAHEAYARLASFGVPLSAMVCVPALNEATGRTCAAARALAASPLLLAHDSLDLVSLGVHGRRSRASLRTAVGNGVAVGIVSLPDEECSPKWWRSASGRQKMMKECLGLLANCGAVHKKE
jgi:hypothetical protein